MSPNPSPLPPWAAPPGAGGALRAAAWAALATLAAVAPLAGELRLVAPAALGVETELEVTVEAVAPTAAATLRLAVDGAEVARGPAPRLTARLPLAWPPRPQRIEAAALDAEGCARELAVRFVRHPARAFPVALELTGAGCDESGPWAWVFGRPPEGHALARVRLFAGARPVGESRRLPAAFRLAGHELAASFLRAELALDDGTTAEATHVLGVAGFGAEVEVRRAELRRVLPAPGLFGREPDLGAAVVRVDGAVQRLVAAERGSALPLELGLALDDSLSMLPLRAAALELAGETGRRLAVAPGSREFLVHFAATQRTAPVAPGGALPAAVEAPLPLGATALYDALAAALHEFDAPAERAALIALTDGCDTRSTGTADEVARLAKVKGIPVYALLYDGEPCRVRKPGAARDELGAMVTEPGWGESRRGLERIARASGGELVRVERKENLAAVWRRILADLERQAVFVFEPSGPEIDPARAEIEIPPARRQDAER